MSWALAQISFAERDATFAVEKERIAEMAASMVKPGQTILLDSGTTTYRIVRHLAKLDNVYTVTNCVKVALELSNMGCRDYVLVGGYIPANHMCVCGELTLEQIGQYRVDTAFLGANGVHIKTGISTLRVDEAIVKRKILSIARRSIVVADNSKIGGEAQAVVAPLSTIDLLITDIKADPAIVKDIRKETRVLLV